MAFQFRPVFGVVAGLHFLNIKYLVRAYDFHEVSYRFGGSLVRVILLCRFFNLPITVEAMKRGGVRSMFLSNRNKVYLKFETSIYHCTRHAL